MTERNEDLIPDLLRRSMALPPQEETDELARRPPPEDMWWVTYHLPRMMAYEGGHEADRYYHIGWGIVARFGREHSTFNEARAAARKAQEELKNRSIPGRMVITDSSREPGFGDFDLEGKPTWP